jgi:hypothetical protein
MPINDIGKIFIEAKNVKKQSQLFVQTFSLYPCLLEQQ